MAETVRLRVVFEDRGMLSKSKKKQGLKRCWFLLKPQHTTISDVASHLLNTFRLHRTCPHGIVLSMDGFVLPSFEFTCILKDKDIVCVKRKGSVSTDDKSAMLRPATCENQAIELQKLLTIEGLQEEESGAEETMSQKDDDDQLEDAVYVESKSDGNVVFKKRKASKKLKSPSQKKIKLSTAENLLVTPKVHEKENGSSEGHEEENGSFDGYIHHQLSLVKKDKKKSSNLSSQPNKSSNLNKQKNDKSDPTSDETRFVQPQDESETKKLPSRSARRKKAKRRWLRELKLEKEKEKLHQTPVLEKGGQELPINDNNCVVSDVHQQPDEESEEEDDIAPVEIRPGHIRFEPLKKDQDQAVPQNQFPVETFQWNGITNKKKGQKWGKERMPVRKQDGYEDSGQDCPTVQNAEKEQTSNVIDFDKLKHYTSLPKEGDVIAYRLIELTASWTPELSSFRVGKISRYDAKSNRIWLEPVLEYPFDFKKKIDEDASSVQYDPSPYQEDGSLEIEYTLLADVRMVKHGIPDLKSDALVNPTKATNDITNEKLAAKAINGSTGEKLAGDQTTVGSCHPERGHITAKENGEVNVWDKINEALKAKKAKLLQEDCWSRGGESSSTRSWSHRAMRCSALGPTMALLRSNNGL
ncbi:coilin-like isoform X2 [Glycine soja]|uniref:Coilin isoform B n=1 Tax=Glycine soja TaxID=3848 RepID=A0A445FMR2_GLYSO|nr:coilin-like isoform X2 [Glycine soja]RZB50149.1 Coilin isoform B [Glycine soja]RZB50150.1 Coilin isoform C [Glycine soja]RZB50151.1 Coilin isoform D [Glycine soja]